MQVTVLQREFICFVYKGKILVRRAGFEIVDQRTLVKGYQGGRRKKENIARSKENRRKCHQEQKVSGKVDRTKENQGKVDRT
ncbi:hypothetical protein CEXT_169511 [Caerostris extrusa]|uniref:Uncharacterized protein n=1 Tax=Caerostris extrusa TaxID=172846 RepID=A0AAV4XHM5_CAEEX|nr:hypothetical protein CEXT_169511 [Caerostris extrusa]